MADQDSTLREELVTSERVFDGGFLHINRDMVRLPDGKVTLREYILHPGAVMIIPLLDDGQVVMERQWRYPLARAFFEAGLADRLWIFNCARAVNATSAPSAAPVPLNFRESGQLNFDGDTLHEYLHSSGRATFAITPSADLELEKSALIS